MDREPVGCKGILISMLVIFGIIAGIAGVVTFALDQGCYYDLTQRLPLYPGAEVVTTYYNMFRPWGMGDTRYILKSSDDTLVVRNWYARNTGADAVERARGGGRVGNADWEVWRDTDGGTLISLHGACMVAAQGQSIRRGGE